MGREARARNTGTPEPPKRSSSPLSETQLETIHAETQRMGIPERIIYWDKRQAFAKPITRTMPGPDGVGTVEETLEPTAILCPHDPKHGALQMSGSGALLICQSRAPGDRNTFCSGSMPVSL